MKALKQTLGTLVGTVLVCASSTVLANPVLDYKITLAEDGETYQVWMRPDVAPSNDLSLSGQVTIKVPNAAKLNIVQIENPIEGVEWIEASRVNAPPEDEASDYISMSFIGVNDTKGFGWEAGKETLVFGFKTDAGCVDGVALMSDDDPFNVKGNSHNTNPGNQFTNLGWGSIGSNNYKMNYGKAISCSK